MRSSVTYRVEKKKLIKSQLNIIKKTLDVIKTVKELLSTDEMRADTTKQNEAYTELLLLETSHEQQLKDVVQARDDLNADEKLGEISELEDQYLMSRLINSDYFRKLLNLVLKNDFV